MMKLFKQIFGNAGSVNSDQRQAQANQPIFDQKFYSDITNARMQHFQSMSIPLSGKSVIDVGCGIGRFSEMLTEMGADVFCVDGRAENIEKLKEEYPLQKCAVCDVESDEILAHGMFDVVFCYGLLYHLMDPMGFIKNASKMCKELMFIETCITDAIDPVVRLVAEDQKNVTQALQPYGCRPSSSYVIVSLKKSGFKYVYRPTSLPLHPQFEYKLKNDYSYIKKGNLIRDIFVASHSALTNPMLRAV